MSKDADRATQLKEDGNSHFQQGNFTIAESLYSKAIIADDTNPSLYTNRAMARLRLEEYDSAISDCSTCLKLTGGNMKAYFVLSQCQLAIQDNQGALDSALQAHRICAETNDKSLAAVTNQVLRCKKNWWDDMEKRRSREGQELEREVIGLLERERQNMFNSCDNDFDRKQVKEEWGQKISTMKATFERARKASEQRRDVPDWAIDDISFSVMVDPVMTKTGKSYERASIMEHLRRHPTDPLTREPLQPGELRPNLGLKQACEEYLEENGWAVDW